MLDSERLRRRAGFAPLLAPENVDAVEWQRRPLTDFR
jgi:hypothetical protein